MCNKKKKNPLAEKKNTVHTPNITCLIENCHHQANFESHIKQIVTWIALDSGIQIAQILLHT